VKLEYIEDEGDKGRSRLFPVAGGVLRTWRRIIRLYLYGVDGIENCFQAVRDILNHKIKKCFIEMSACAGSCIGGPAMDKNRRARSWIPLR
jgi:hypothetical protein